MSLCSTKTGTDISCDMDIVAYAEGRVSHAGAKHRPANRLPVVLILGVLHLP